MKRLKPAFEGDGPDRHPISKAGDGCTWKIINDTRVCILAPAPLNLRDLREEMRDRDESAMPVPSGLKGTVESVLVDGRSQVRLDDGSFVTQNVSGAKQGDRLDKMKDGSLKVNNNPSFSELIEPSKDLRQKMKPRFDEKMQGARGLKEGMKLSHSRETLSENLGTPEERKWLQTFATKGVRTTIKSVNARDNTVTFTDEAGALQATVPAKYMPPGTKEGDVIYSEGGHKITNRRTGTSANPTGLINYILKPVTKADNSGCVFRFNHGIGKVICYQFDKRTGLLKPRTVSADPSPDLVSGLKDLLDSGEVISGIIQGSHQKFDLSGDPMIDNKVAQGRDGKAVWMVDSEHYLLGDINKATGDAIVYKPNGDIADIPVSFFSKTMSPKLGDLLIYDRDEDKVFVDAEATEKSQDPERLKGWLKDNPGKLAYVFRYYPDESMVDLVDEKGNRIGYYDASTFPGVTKIDAIGLKDGKLVIDMDQRKDAEKKGKKISWQSFNIRDDGQILSVDRTKTQEELLALAESRKV